MGEDEKKEERRIHVDEEWKETVQREKQTTEREREREDRAAAEERAVYPEPNIQVFMAGLFTQTLVALGHLEHPQRARKEVNLAEARYLIDTIDMLSEKTQGNLSDQESGYVENLKYDLKMRYIEATKAKKTETEEKGQQ